MKLRVDEVELPNGHILPEYHVLEYPDWTLSMCLADDGHLILVDQYRHATGHMSLEFASGMLEKGEQPLNGAQRELLEETGYEAEDWTLLGSWAPDPSRHSNVGHVFLCRGAQPTARQRLDVSEEMTIVPMRPTDVDASIRNGRISHGLHVAAFYRAVTDGLLTL